MRALTRTMRSTFIGLIYDSLSEKYLLYFKLSLLSEDCIYMNAEENQIKSNNLTVFIDFLFLCVYLCQVCVSYV